MKAKALLVCAVALKRTESFERNASRSPETYTRASVICRSTQGRDELPTPAHPIYPSPSPLRGGLSRRDTTLSRRNQLSYVSPESQKSWDENKKDTSYQV